MGLTAYLSQKQYSNFLLLALVRRHSQWYGSTDENGKEEGEGGGGGIPDLTFLRQTLCHQAIDAVRRGCFWCCSLLVP